MPIGDQGDGEEQHMTWFFALMILPKHASKAVAKITMTLMKSFLPFCRPKSSHCVCMKLSSENPYLLFPCFGMFGCHLTTRGISFNHANHTIFQSTAPAHTNQRGSFWLKMLKVLPAGQAPKLKGTRLVLLVVVL